MSDTMTPAAATLTAAFSSSPPATPQAASPATPPAAPPAPAHSSPVGPQGEITVEQAAQIVRDVRADLEKGNITAEEATRRFDQLGATPEQRAPDIRSEEVKALDAAFPPARPQDFIIPYYPPGQAPPVMSKELQAWDTSARAWLAGAEFDRTLGNSLVTQISRVVQQTKAMSPGQLESYRMVEHEKLQRAHGEKLGERLQAADDMIDQLEEQRPGLKQILGSIGVGRNAMIWNMLIGQAERWHARRKGR